MGQLLLRNFDDHLKSRLKERARRHGVSMEEEARRIMRAALAPDEREYGLGSEIAALFRHIEWGEEELERLPSSEVRPASFD
ncbi:MAG TPA: plasmid stabilization protein [Mesorhizobium sp.]|jgi:plasmid stability protein|nr:plasmid stabilization protein [Mesorhizobium sp.]